MGRDQERKKSAFTPTPLVDTGCFGIRIVEMF